MTRRFLAFSLLTATFAIFLSACDGNSSRSGGPGSETTNGIAATVSFDDGTPAAFASIAIRKSGFIPDDSSGSVLVPDFETDSLGHFEIDSLEPDSYRITVGEGGKLFTREFAISDSGYVNLGQINLSEPGSATGSLVDPDGIVKNVWVGVYGLDILVRTDSAGSFSLEGLPAGNLDLFILTDVRDSVLANTSLDVISSETVSWTHALDADTALADTAVWMLYEDFEDSAAFAGKSWYFTADSLSSISSPTSNVWEGVVEDADRGGHVFKGSYVSVVGSWVIFGTSISDSGQDFSALDSVTFYAKGSGYIRLSLERWEADSTNNLKAWTDNIALTDSWTEIRVAPADFLLPENDSLSTGFESVEKTVTRFHIFGLGGTEIDLDDIRVYGVKF